MGTVNPSWDAGSSWVTAWGVSNVPFTSSDQSAAAASVTGAPSSGQSIVVDDIFISVAAAMSVTLKEETSGTIMFGPFYLPANSVLQLTPRGRRQLPVVNKKLQVQTSGAGNISVLVGYHSE